LERIPVAKTFVAEQIRTLDESYCLRLRLDPGTLAKGLVHPVIELYKQIRNIHVTKPPEYRSASPRLEAFVLLNARVSAWLAAWPELTQETIALSVREDQNDNSSERRTLDSYQAQSQKHPSTMPQSLSSIYDKLIKNTKQYYDDPTLDEFARLRASIADSEGRLGIPQSSYRARLQNCLD